MKTKEVIKFLHSIVLRIQCCLVESPLEYAKYVYPEIPFIFLDFRLNLKHCGIFFTNCLSIQLFRVTQCCNNQLSSQSLDIFLEWSIKCSNLLVPSFAIVHYVFLYLLLILSFRISQFYTVPIYFYLICLSSITSNRLHLNVMLQCKFLRQGRYTLLFEIVV